MSDSYKPAFPLHPAIQCDGPPTDWLGMTLRDWFAGQALAGMLSNPGLASSTVTEELLGQQSYNFADAMLEARKAKP